MSTETGLNPSISTPDSSTQKISRSFASRIRDDICFNCQNKGHWARDCPSKSFNKSSKNYTNPNPNPASMNCTDFPDHQCPCGSGTCITVVSSTQRKFYRCPVKVGRCKYFKWCDEVTVEGNNSPQFPYPVCDCGAGICDKYTENSGPNTGRNYFLCPIPKGHGACSFFQWQDPQEMPKINGDRAESNCFGSPLPTLKNLANSDSVEDGDFSIKRLKRNLFESPAIDTPLQSPSKRNKLLLIESIENDGSVPYSTTSQLVTNSLTSVIEKAPKASLLKSSSEIHRRQTEFWRQISAAGATSVRDPTYQILGGHVPGWLGRLAFPPTKCLTIPDPKPFFCCVFPSFDFIFVPQNVDVSNNKCTTILPHSPTVVESDISGWLSMPTPAQNALFWEPSGLKSPPKVVQGNIMTGSILEAFGQAAAHVQNDVLTLLESMDPRDHKTMVREANSAFEALDRLSVDYKSFYKRVREFILCVFSLAGIEQSIHNDTSQEIIDSYNCEKHRYDDLSRNYDEMTDAFKASVDRLHCLREEVTRVKNFLIEVESQLSSCEAETMDFETHLVLVWEEMLESKQTLQVASQEADKAQKLRQQREAEQRVAKEAFEKARRHLRK